MATLCGAYLLLFTGWRICMRKAIVIYRGGSVALGLLLERPIEAMNLNEHTSSHHRPVRCKQQVLPCFVFRGRDKQAETHGLVT